MTQIAEKLQEGLVNASELKEYAAAICCESYYDLPSFQEERTILEKNYPAYAENTECTGNQQWGAFKLGRLPAFIYEDAKNTRSAQSMHSPKGSQISSVMPHETDLMEGALYKKKVL